MRSSFITEFSEQNQMMLNDGGIKSGKSENSAQTFCMSSTSVNFDMHNHAIDQ